MPMSREWCHAEGTATTTYTTSTILPVMKEDMSPKEGKKWLSYLMLLIENVTAPLRQGDVQTAGPDTNIPTKKILAWLHYPRVYDAIVCNWWQLKQVHCGNWHFGGFLACRYGRQNTHGTRRRDSRTNCQTWPKYIQKIHMGKLKSADQCT